MTSAQTRIKKWFENQRILWRKTLEELTKVLTRGKLVPQAKLLI